MNCRLAAACGLLFCLPIPLTRAVVQADDADDAKGHSIRIQVLLVESSGDLDQEDRSRLSGPSDQVMKSIGELAAEGKATLVNQIEMTVLEETEAMLQVGETVAKRSGTQNAGMGKSMTIYQDVSVGTIVRVMTKVVGEHVVMDMDFEKSFVAPSVDDDPGRPQGVSQLTHQSTLRIENGSAQLVGRMLSRRSGDEKRAVQLIVAADVLDSAAAAQKTRFQTFSRQPPRPSVASSRTPSRSSRGSSSRSSREEQMSRGASSIFDRADTNDDGVISASEMPRLGPFQSRVKPPISKDQFNELFKSYVTGRRTATPPRPPSQRDSRSRREEVEIEVKDKEIEIEVKDKAVGRSSKPSGEDVEKAKRGIGETQIQVVPDLGTIIIRGAKSDVERVVEVIKKLEEEEDGDEDDDDDEDESSTEDEDRR